MKRIKHKGEDKKERLAGNKLTKAMREYDDNAKELSMMKSDKEGGSERKIRLAEWVGEEITKKLKERILVADEDDKENQNEDSNDDDDDLEDMIYEPITNMATV